MTDKPGSKWTWTLTCSAASLLVLGYHPAAEDGGIYYTALLQRLNPDLFPRSHEFAHAHLDLSFYLAALEAVHRLLPLPLPYLVLLLHIASVVATIWGASKLAEYCFDNIYAQRGAVLAVALGLSLPVAGTALYLADPYLTARSFSTPLVMFGCLFAFRKQWAYLCICLLCMAALHPLMAIWGGLLLLGAAATQERRPVRMLIAAAIFLVIITSIVYVASPHENSLMLELAHTRGYWYLSHWEWYEWLGLIGPMILLALPLRWPSTTDKHRNLQQTALFTFSVSLLLSVLFVHFSDNRILIARMQPLRALVPAYLLFLMLFGAWLAERVLRSSLTAWGLATLLTMLPLVAMQRSIYSSSTHLEFPWRAPRNQWVQAFQWIQTHTPTDAYFALDAKYTVMPGEDAQCFRAIAERSSLPDAAKDGGVASVSTKLAREWEIGVAAQADLEDLNDIERIQSLKPLGADWMVLSQNAATSFACPYTNEVVKVCKLPEVSGSEHSRLR